MNINYYDMLTYRRKEGSKGQKVFNRKYLQPVFGKPDAHGNYTLIVGKKPRVAFMAHHDTVHKKLGKVDIYVDNGAVYSDGTDVLGADCTTGIYLILRMIEAGVPGVYVVHAGEEIGCIGSSALVEDHPDWIDHVDFAISFDRKGYSEVITHQCGIRTCSDEFAESLAGILDLDMEPSDQGVYTDSNEYRGVIAECTNISVGYFHQHTIKEYQDLDFLDLLEDALINADWSKLVKKRIPAMENRWSDFDDWSYPYYKPKSHFKGYGNKKEELVDVVRQYPEQVAAILRTFGYSPDGLRDDCLAIRKPYSSYQ